METFKEALYSLYKKLQGTNFDKDKIDDDILNTIKYSNMCQVCGSGAENAFKEEADRLNKLNSGL